MNFHYFMVFLDQEFQSSLTGCAWVRFSQEAAITGSYSLKAGMGLEELWLLFVIFSSSPAGSSS